VLEIERGIGGNPYLFEMKDAPLLFKKDIL
jgi:hypothetical protein